jgi:hypothetical protein
LGVVGEEEEEEVFLALGGVFKKTTMIIYI